MVGRILIADDVMTNRIILKARLGSAAFPTLQASTPEALLSVARADAPDLILLSDSLSDLDTNALLRRLRNDALTSETPIIVLSEHKDRTARIRLLEAGADAVMLRLPDDAMLRARISNLLRRRAAEDELSRDSKQNNVFELAESPQADFMPPGQIALIAGTLAEGLKWRNGLAARMRDRITVIDPAQAMSEIDAEPAADAIVIAEHPENPGEAMQILSDLRCRSATLRAATVIVQTRADTQRAIMALNLGASDLVDDGFEAEEMALILRRELKRKAQNDSRREALKDGLRLAATDPLTGLFNRRYALGQLEKIAQTSAERKECFAVMVLDLDRFKRINDIYGHACGDAVLTEVASRMSACMRHQDFLARIGGEEFLAVIRSCDMKAAEVAAERLRSAVADLPVELPDGKGAEAMTMSIGLVVAGGSKLRKDPATLIDLADRGLYAAKADGRNQVMVYRIAA